MSHDQLLRDLKEKTAYQEEQIYILRKKLASLDEVIAKKEELQTQYNNLKRWIEDTKYKEKQMHNDLLVDYDKLSEKLTKAETAEGELKREKNKLTDVNDRITEQLNDLKQNENKILSENTNLKTSLKCVQSELHKVKVSVAKMSFFKLIATNQ